MAMPLAEAWTIEDLDRLPDDGNRYEVLDGELFVTPAPSELHETVLVLLHGILDPFVQANSLGWIQRRGVLRKTESQLEPDLIVRPHAPLRGWEAAPLPTLIVEVLSGSTRNRDLGKKKDFYVRTGIPEYWIVDRSAEVIHQVRGAETQLVRGVLRWAPPGTVASLDVDIEKMFADIKARM